MKSADKSKILAKITRAILKVFRVYEVLVDMVEVISQLVSLNDSKQRKKLTSLVKQEIDEFDEYAWHEYKNVSQVDKNAVFADCVEAIVSADSASLIVGALTGASDASKIVQDRLDKMQGRNAISQDAAEYQSALVLRIGTLLANWVRTEVAAPDVVLEGVSELLRRDSSIEEVNGPLGQAGVSPDVAHRSKLILPEGVARTVGAKVGQKPIIIQGREVQAIDLSRLSAIEITGKRNWALQTASTSSLASYQYSISTAFWGGDYSQSAVSSHDNLVKAISVRDFNVAVLTLSNLLLIYRSKGDVKMFEQLLRYFIPKIPLQEVDNAFLYRLWKELFVHYYEVGKLEFAQKYLARMERIDAELSVYTPADDWLPGTIRWRKAHLDWRLEPSVETLDRAIILAREGVQYLNDRIADNPNSAGLASGYLNLGWLYFLKGDAGCISYFEGAEEMARKYSPRTLLEAQIAEGVGRAILFDEPVERDLSELQKEVRRSRLGVRSYSFLEQHSEWSRIKRMTDG